MLLESSGNPGSKLVKKRHQAWVENEKRWQWLLDSFEGGDRYRRATYGVDSRGEPVRNLIRHKREYGDSRDRSSQAGILTATQFLSGEQPIPEATDGDYEMRLARTPVPTFLREAIEGHLDEIYSMEVIRSGPEEVVEWWSSVNEDCVSMSEWMQETVAPLLMTFGMLDILVESPRASGEAYTEAEAIEDGLDSFHGSVILPQNMLWWRMRQRRYVECLTREYTEDMEVRYRHWTPERWTLYDKDGAVVDSGPTQSGFIPIVRLFDRRKHRCAAIGQPRYERVAESQREFYNRDSELILSDTTQAHPLLQGPEDYVSADGTIPIGPSWLLPKKKNTNVGSASYEGFDVIEFPKAGAESIRRNKADIKEDIDRDINRLKPAGSREATKGTSEQSGVSKSIDNKARHDLLARIARTLLRAEYEISELAARLIGVDPEAIRIVYPTNYSLYTASDIAVSTLDFLNLASKSRIGMPKVTLFLLSRLFRTIVPGLSEDEYEAFDAEIEAHVSSPSPSERINSQLDASAATRLDISDPTNREQDVIGKPEGTEPMESD